MKSRTVLLISVICLFLRHVSLCAQDELIIYSPDYLKANDTVWVLKPSHFEATRKYPVVFMLHGHGGNFRNYLNNSHYQDIADRYGFILVTPDGFRDCWYIDAPNPDEKQFESFFFKELLPELERRYPIDANNRFITGISMGGHGAMWLFLRHPDCFRSAGSCSGVLELRFSGNRDGSLARILGDYADGANVHFRDFSCIHHLENIAGKDKYIYFDCGTEDYLYESAGLFRARCDALKIKACSIFSPGKHQSSYFDDAFRAHFDFFAKQVIKSVKE
ncbi:MAG: esterase family protein [Prevotellaceae bacterium]|jgi:S-formylglutathione hydrolase FrmB|nr:esterase family protein [Prevotellaceae bacterium]